MKNNRTDSDFIDWCIKIHHYTHHNRRIVLCNPKYSSSNHKNWKGNGYIPLDCFTSIKRGAIQRNIDFSLKIQDLNDRFLWQSGKCHLSGEDLYFSKRSKTGNASLDRIDNTKGYTLDNIQWLHKEVNLIKYTMSQSDLLYLCKLITKKFTPNVAISGYFQILHAGHIDYIQMARNHGGYLIVIINSDKQAKLKSTPSVVNENDRSYIIQNIRGVDETIISIDEDGSVSKTLELIKPSVFCNGGDRNPSNYSSAETEICNKLGIKMIFLGGEKRNSSSNILKSAANILSDGILNN